MKYNESRGKSHLFATYGLALSYVVLFIFKEIKGINNYDLMAILLMYIGFMLSYKGKDTKNIVWLLFGVCGIIASIILIGLYISQM